MPKQSQKRAKTREFQLSDIRHHRDRRIQIEQTKGQRKIRMSRRKEEDVDVRVVHHHQNHQNGPKEERKRRFRRGVKVVSRENGTLIIPVVEMEVRAMTPARIGRRMGVRRKTKTVKIGKTRAMDPSGRRLAETEVMTQMMMIKEVDDARMIGSREAEYHLRQKLNSLCLRRDEIL